MKSIKEFLFGDTKVFIKMKRWMALSIWGIFSALLSGYGSGQFNFFDVIAGIIWVGIPWFIYLKIKKKL